MTFKVRDIPIGSFAKITNPSEFMSNQLVGKIVTNDNGNIYQVIDKKLYKITNPDWLNSECELLFGCLYATTSLDSETQYSRIDNETL